MQLCNECIRCIQPKYIMLTCAIITCILIIIPILPIIPEIPFDSIIGPLEKIIHYIPDISIPTIPELPSELPTGLPSGLPQILPDLHTIC